MKLFNIIATSVLGAAMAIGVGVAAANHKEASKVQASTGSYTLTFDANSNKSGSGTSLTSDGGTALTTSNFATSGTYSFKVSGTTYYWLCSGCENIASVDSIANVYPGKNSSLKVGKAAGDGTLNFTIDGLSSISIDSVVITAYGAATSAKITVAEANDATKQQSMKTSSDTYTFVYDDGGKTVSITGGAGLTSSNKVAYITQIVINYTEGAADLDMKVVNSSDNEGPFAMSYGDAGGSLFHAKDGSDVEITSGVTWTVSDASLLTLETDYADNHCWVKPNTNNKVGTATLTATKSGYKTVVSEITVLKGDLESIAISGAMSRTSYALDSLWDPSGLVVTATYDTGFTADVTSGVVWSYSPATPNSLSLVSVVATATYTENAIEKSASTSAITISVFQGATYDLSKIDGFSSWTNSYGAHDVSSSDIDGASADATLNFQITNRQTSGVGTDYPCIGAKTNSEVECLKFTLTEASKKISTVDITFITRYTSTYPSVYLHKGAGIATSSIADLTMSGAQGSEHVLSYDNLNDTVFTVGYNAHQTSSNGAVVIKSISVGLAEVAAFGTTDHIKVTSYPKTIYHVGELYDETGLAVTAYDNADEAIANFKDITAEISTGFKSGVYRFDDGDVPTVSMWVEYIDAESNLFSTDIDMQVYALAEYELVDSTLDDWSGNYLIVATNADSDLVAMDGSLANPDAEAGYKVVEDNAGTIEAGQELEWTIAPVTGGYAISGKSNKYIGSLTTKSNGMLVSETSLVNTLSYDGAGVAIVGTNTYHLTFNTDGDRFRYYASGNVQLYKLKDSSAASDFADDFLETLSGASPICKADGSTNLSQLKTAWKSLADAYALLSNADKEQFRLGVANSAPEATNIAKALALYDFIAAKYNTQLESAELADYNFMNRTIAPLHSGVMTINQTNVHASVAVIAIITVISLAAVGTFFILRKKRYSK